MKKTILVSFILLMMIFSAKAQFNQSFAANTIPSGWTVLNGGDINTWNIGNGSSVAPHSPSYHARISYNATTAHDDYLVTPQITVQAGVNDRISFWVANLGTSFIEHFDVKLSNTTATAANFTTTLLGDTAAPNTYTKFTLNLSAYIGQTIFVGFHATSLNMYELYLDDIVNDAIPICNLSAPTISSVSPPVDCNTGNTTIALTGLPSTGTWTLYRTGTSSASFTSTGTSTTVTLPTAGTIGNYSFYVKDANLCQSPSSETVTLHPLHEIDMYAPMTGAYADSNSNGILDVGDTINYQIQVHNSGTCSLSNTSVNGAFTAYNPNLNFSGNTTTNIPVLESNTTTTVAATYAITQNDIDNLQADNTTIVNAHWSDNAGGNSTAYFPMCVVSLKNLSTRNFVFETFKYTPNPVKNYLSVSNANSIDTIEITSVLGQKVFSKKVNGLQDALDLSSLEKGIYFVRVLSKGFEKTFKIIKE